MALLYGRILHETYIQYRAVAYTVIIIAVTLHQPVITADCPRFRISPYAALEIHCPKGNSLIPKIKYPPVYYKPILPSEIAIQPILLYPPTDKYLKNISK